MNAETKSVDVPPAGPLRLEELSAAELVAHLDRMRAHEREQLVEFLQYLAEVDRRHVSLELGFPSLWSFCVEHLRLSKGAAYRRFTACRLLSRFPVVADYLASGQLCLTTLCLLKDVLEEANHRELLERAAGQTEDQLKVLVATLRPQEVPPDLLRRLPALKSAQVAGVGSGPELGCKSGPDLAATTGIGSGPEPMCVTSREPDRVRPINAERHVLRVSIGGDCRAELEQVVAALSHQVPHGNLEAVLRVCFQTTLKVYAKRRGLVNRPRAGATPTEKKTGRLSWRSRYVPAHVRREVWRRDGFTCTYVGLDGRRCGSRYQAELDHDGVPFAVGGEPTAENLTVRCRAHNQHGARKYFGAAFMAQFGSGRNQR